MRNQADERLLTAEEAEHLARIFDRGKLIETDDDLLDLGELAEEDE